MAIVNITARGSAVSNTSTTTLAMNPTANLVVGRIVFVSCASDNNQTTDGASTFHSVSDSQGHVWTKICEYTDSDGASNDGSVVSLFATKVRALIATTDTITLTLGAAKTDKIICAFEATFNINKTFAVAQVGVGQGALAASVSGLTSREYLLIGAGASEGNDNTKTADADYTERFDLRTGSGTANTEICNHVQTRVATLTSDTCTSTGWTNTNPVQTLSAIYEADDTGSVSLDTADSLETNDTTPALEFTGTEANSEDLIYQIQINTSTF